ncbi:MAG TPA: hypothetical protein VH855_12525 [Acetobacteraceae bacterium]|jgi:6-phosphogluconolactonase (cycloisomerase 2 family)
MEDTRGARRLWLTVLAAFAGPAISVRAADLPPRSLYAVNESPEDRGSISVYDIDAGHRLVKTIHTVTDVEDVRGVAGSASTGRLYVTYRDRSGNALLYCLDLYQDTVLWNRKIPPGVDRLANDPGGQLLYVPTGEGETADYIQVLDAKTGDLVRKVYFSSRSHDAQYPLAGPLFQETKADDGSGNYLYMIDPRSYAVSRIGPYLGILGPYAVDGSSTYVVNDVTALWGMQVADLKTGRIVTAELPEHPRRRAGLMHGIGWTPDQREVWQSGEGGDPHVYVWNMQDPMAPILQAALPLRSGHGSHWLTFSIQGDYAYVAPNKNSSDGTEVFAVASHSSAGLIGASEDMLEVDFADGKITRTGDQYGIGRRR